MKPTKTINITFGDKFKACYTLEFSQDEEGEEYGILTCPYVKWLTLEEQVVLTRTYTIKGDVLACIEKYYFDDNVISIPVKGYPYGVEMMDITEKIIGPKIYKQMLSGTFKRLESADY